MRIVRRKLTDECKAVTNYIIEKTNEYNRDKSFRDVERDLLNLNKVNGILFLFQLCYTEKYGKLAFEDEFYAGTHGPAIDNIYYEYHYIGFTSQLVVAPTNIVISNEMKEILDEIFAYTRPLSPKKLRDIVQKSELWYSVYDPNEKEYRYKDIISNDKILDYCQNCDKQQLVKIKTLS